MTTYSKIIYKLLVILLIGLVNGSAKAQEVSREMVYVHTDRTVYIAGEKLFFKLYLLDASTHKHSEISKIGYVILRAANQNPTIKCRIKIEAGSAWGSISLPDTLSSGVYQIVAFTNSMKNYDEQHFFKNEIVIINGFDKDMRFNILTPNNRFGSDSIDKLLNITTNKEKYNTREKVFVRIDNTNQIHASLSVSVSEDPNIQTSCNSIVEALNKTTDQAVNNPPSGNYLSERTGEILRGKVVDTVTGQPINQATVLLSCVDTVANLQYAITNSKGTFQMLLSNYYEGREMFFTIRDMPANQHWKIEIEDKYALSERWNPALKYDIGSAKDFFTKSQHIAYVNQSYQTNQDASLMHTTSEKLICPQLYFCLATSVYLSDYTSLNDFKEIVVELFPQVRISKENGKYRISVLNGSQKMFSQSEIAIFLDGVYVDDVEKIMKLGSEQLKKIEVLNTERVFGNLVYKGVISIFTKSTEIEKTTPCPYSLRIKNDKINGSDNYVIGTPDTVYNQRFPFFKQLLYWNPALEIKEKERVNFDFLTSDNEGNYILKIEGITNDGQPISFSSNLQIINQPRTTEK